LQNIHAAFSGAPVRRLLIASLVALSAACRQSVPPSAASPSYLFVWAGDSAMKASDFLAVIDANAASPRYGSVVASVPTGTAGTHPHHTEAELSDNGHLLANGFATGQTWLFDVSDALHPKILTQFGEVGGLSHPHTYVRLGNGHVLATFQYAADSLAAAPTHGQHAGMGMPVANAGQHATGGLIEMDERGTLLRRGSAADTNLTDRRLYPYSVLPLPSIDRAVSTTTDMDHADTVATAQWVQIWRLSDLTLLRSIALPRGPRGDEQNLTGEPHLLPDGKGVYIHTFKCGLYLVRGVESAVPTASFVKGFAGSDCGVPVLTGHWWLQPVPDTHALVAMDITDPEHPREVSSVTFGDDEFPHWISMDKSGRRIVLNSGGYGAGNRLFIVHFDPTTGALAIDDKFRDAGATSAGVRMNGKSWPHGFTGNVLPHGSVFSRQNPSATGH
jgi:hypothetical protein